MPWWRTSRAVPRCRRDMRPRFGYELCLDSREAPMTSVPSLMHRPLKLAIAIGMLALAALPACAQSDLASAYRIIASKRFVDLTHSFGPDSPVWSGFGQEKLPPEFDPKDKRPYPIP